MDSSNKETALGAREGHLSVSGQRPRSSTLTSGRSVSQGQLKSNHVIRSPLPVKIELHKVGIYGWRKRFLYFLVILITALVIINAALLYWIIRLLDLSIDGIGSIKLHSKGMTLDGDAFVLNDLLASSIRSAQSGPLQLDSQDNVSINGKDDESGRIINRLRLNSSTVEVMGRQFAVRSNDGKLLFMTDKDTVMVATDKLRINNVHGIQFNTSLRTPLVRSSPFQDLNIVSPTRSIFIKGPRGIWMDSRAGDLTATCLRDLKLKSTSSKRIYTLWNENMLQTSKVRRSISCYSLPALGVADGEDHEEDERAEERREMHEALRVRKEALESAMQAKLAELKALCLREAELTGVLPAETPLRPNEPRPVIRRRMRTEFALSDKLLTEPTSKDEETLANLELEFEIQNKIVAASLKLMNELQTNKSIRKHRKQAYDDAVRKLNTLEQKLVPLRNKLDEVRRGKGRKKQLIIDELNKDSGISDVNIAPGTDLHTKRIKKKRLKIGNESSANPHSVPSSPMHVRHDSVPSQKTVHIPESPVEERHRNHSQYPNVAKLMPNQRSSLKSLSRKMVDSDTDTVSLNSDGMASVIIHDDVRERSDPTLLAHRFRYRPATAVGLPTTDSQLYKDKESAGSYQKSARASPIDNLAELKAVSLVRTNSLDNSRRKSYISAITSPPSAVSLQHNYMNNHPLRLMRQPKTLPKNPPPPIPVSEHFLQRPLPPPPVTHSSSVPDVTSPISEQENVEPQLIASANGSLRRHHRKRQDSEIDISARAVRSSVIRTPVGITISTTSSSETQHNHGSNVLPPTPVKGASKMIPLPPKPMEEDRISVFSLQTVAESACNWPDQQSDIPSRPSSVASSRSFSSAVYKPLPSHVDNLQGPMQRSSVVSNQDSSQALASDELEGIKFRQDFNSETRDNVETPRPQSIPLAPSVVSTGGQVDVVAVGHFTPYWEETKPYELSDFYKYSAKHRKQAMQPPTGDPNQDPKPSISGNNSVIDRSKHSSSGAEFKSNQQAINQPLSSRLHGEHLQPPNESLLNESFITRAAVADDFHEEMLDWYDQNLKKPTVV